MVAEWSRAETGVGPSMASGSQTWIGNWALLPMTPQKISRAQRVIWGCVSLWAMAALLMSKMPSPGRLRSFMKKVRKTRPMKKPISPKRVTTKAFLPASEAENFSYQKPIKR